MRVGAFELGDPLPELREPHALATLRPWVDVGGVGNLALDVLEQHLGAKPLGHLARPGNFLDFTRYRPTIYTQEGQRQIAVPNSFVRYSQQAEGRDFVFLHLLEPHAFGEDYVDSVLGVLEKLGVKRYSLVGAMYDMVPHTRPLRISGSAVGVQAEQDMKKVDVKPSTYQGPTTIMALISNEAVSRQMETMSLVVRLPQYVPLDEDHGGELCLLRTICTIYGLTLDLGEIEQKANKQMTEVNRAVEHNPQLKEMVNQLEKYYEYSLQQESAEKSGTLSPEVEKFLKDISKRFGAN
ncbi:MAG: PAC2 family protein [Chloroflexi bacterium]|nr:PAC2 family protein [Chloroflexota bacterium]